MADYIIVGGINGAGKSTIINELIKENEEAKVVNPDVIAKELENENIQGMTKDIKALRMADGMLKDSFKKKESVIHETTLSGSSIKNYINLAKLQGYKVRLVFISIASTEIANKNIAERVSKGGHNIPKDQVERRYPKTFKNLINISSNLDQIVILDNSSKNYKNILNVKRGHIKYKNPNIPEYLQKTVEKVIGNSRKFGEHKIIKCTNREIEKIKNGNIKFTENPFNTNKILISGKEQIKALDKILDFARER